MVHEQGHDTDRRPGAADRHSAQLPDKGDAVVPLTSEQVLALDAARLDAALQLNLKLSAALIGPGAGTHGQVHSEAPLRMEPEHWLRQLDGLGAELALMLRVPAPLTDPGAVGPPPSGPTAPAAASRAQTVARLRQARQELRDGNYEASVRTSRLAMDSLDMLNPLPPAKALHAKQADQRDQAERWAVLRYALRNLASGAACPPSGHWPSADPSDRPRLTPDGRHARQPGSRSSQVTITSVPTDA